MKMLKMEMKRVIVSYQGEAYCGAHTDQASCPEVITDHLYDDDDGDGDISFFMLHVIVILYIINLNHLRT